ncbi:MAG: GDP-mannose 4,6-dehydratase [Fibrobacterota bacterium]
MSILITGASGFVGRHAVRYFLENTTLQVFAADIAHTDTLSDGRLHRFDTDLTSFDAVLALIRQTKSRRVLHLAGLSSVSASVKEPHKTLCSNLISGANLLEALRLENPLGRLLAVSSSEVYGIPRNHEVVRLETHPLRPETPYAVSKAGLELMARQYFVNYGLKNIIARPFNHTGPGQSETFVLSSFARRLMEIKLFSHEPVIYTGNIEVERDFLDVADVVRAYHLLLEKGRPGEAYNVCSGSAMPLRWMLEEMIKLADVRVEIRLDLSLARKFDIPVLLGSNEKIASETGWKPSVPFTETLGKLLQYWEKALREKTLLRENG